VTPFLVGIDLGTTNSAVAFVDTRARRPHVELFAIPQLTDPSVVSARSVLPSFLYFTEPHEAESGAFALPWNASPDAIAGILARERGALAPARHVSSAKSWLAHPGVDRRAALLPWGVASGPRLSPVEASARLLMHVRDAWNATVAAGDERLRFERQRIVVTVPASFDEEARELTVEAARAAQFTDLTLLEEPIAAFYAWMAGRRSAARAGAEMMQRDRVALVCDVGGGTTDFSLIRVALDESGAPLFERMAIGDHLLLGGDNVDLALAALAERRLAASRPDLRLAITQRAALRRTCSAAKEQLLADESIGGGHPVDRVAVTVLGAGRAVVGAAMTTELTRQDVQQIIEDFLPITAPGEIAAARDRRAGLRELGLPYETDPAITRHLAGFLARSAAATTSIVSRAIVGGREMVRPDLVLFNGGFFTPAVARERVVDAMKAWFGDAPQVLTPAMGRLRSAAGHLEAAVAIGAATYARLRANVGPPLALIKAGSGRAYYVALRAARQDDAVLAVCVLARGTDEGTHVALEQPFTVATNRPISFALYSSTVRSDRAGDVVSLRPDEAGEHAPLVTVLRYGKKSRQVELPVRLSVTFTEVGTLELWCESQVSDHRWRLQFQLRGGDEPFEPGEDDRADAAGDTEGGDEAREADAVIADEAVAAGEDAIRAVFEGRGGAITSENLVAHLEQTTGYGKTAWPLPVIRRFADALIAAAAGRKTSAAHEARWFNLFGFCFRPGFGAAKDPWRTGEARTIYGAGLAFPNAIQNRVEWLVLWQRVAGGFSAGQQQELARRVMSELGLAATKAPRLNPQVERESWRVLASLERLDAAARVKIGDELIRRVRRDAANASLLWAIGRLGARVPLYGPLSSVVPPDDAVRWMDGLLSLKLLTPDVAAAVVQIGARVGDPMRDIDDEARDRALTRLRDAGTSPDALRPLEEVVEASGDRSRVFGEPLPEGLRLHEP
jgi:hypothetical protein